MTSTFPRWKGDHEPPFVFELSKRLTNQFKVTVLAPHAAGAKKFEEFEGIQIIRFQYFFTRWELLAYNGGIVANLKKTKLNYLLIPFFILAELIKLIRLLRKFDIDVIHAHWIIPQGLVAVIGRILSHKKPAILCTSHGGDLFGLSGLLLSWIKRTIIMRTDKCTVVSYAMRDYVLELAGREDVEVIPMGVDLFDTFIPAPHIKRNSHEILFVGRLVEKKGVRHIIAAMQGVLQSHPHTTLTIAGDGPERAELHQLAATLGIAPYIKFLGSIDNAHLPHLYRRAALFVAPSVVAQGGDQEGLGLVFVEALGCECPIISSDIPAIRDVIIDGVTGLICKQKDIADLTEKIRFLLDHPDIGQKLGQAGRMHVANRFNWPTISMRYSNLIQELA